MKLNKLNERIYYTDYEELRDRPVLGYLKGNNFSIAIDAGHSRKHLEEFYKLLKDNNLPLPELTIITHWHWDHSFAMHCVNGLTIAHKNTNALLQEFINNRSKENDEKFLNLDPSIAKEYENNEPIIVETSDIEYTNDLVIDAGSLLVKVLKAPSPHCDDATFVYLPNEKVIFIGDGTSGVFPTWKTIPEKAKELIEFLKPLDIDYSIGGHWPIEDKKAVIDTLEYDIKYNHI